MRWARGRRPPIVVAVDVWRFPRGRCYHTAPLVPFEVGRSCYSRSEDQHGPFLRYLRQGVDGRIQPPVIGDEPRPRSPPHGAKSPAIHDRRERQHHEGARLHTLPPHVGEERQVAGPVPAPPTDRSPDGGRFSFVRAPPVALPRFAPAAAFGQRCARGTCGLWAQFWPDIQARTVRPVANPWVGSSRSAGRAFHAGNGSLELLPEGSSRPNSPPADIWP